MSGVEAKHRYSGRVSNIDLLLAAVESDLRRSIVSADAEIPFVAGGAKIENRGCRVELEDLPALAVGDQHVARHLKLLPRGRRPDADVAQSCYWIVGTSRVSEMNPGTRIGFTT